MPTFTNRAFLTYNNITTGSNVATGEILEVLSATKTAVTEDYSAGDTVTYVVNIINSGAVAYTGLTLTDNLGAYAFDALTLTPLTYIDDSLRYFENGNTLLFYKSYIIPTLEKRPWYNRLFSISSF